MIRRGAAAALAVILWVVPMEADGQWTEWTGLCTPDGLFCGSFGLGLYYDAVSDDTEIRIRMSNLQGLHSWSPTVRSAIYRASFNHLSVVSDRTGSSGQFGNPSIAIGEADTDGFYQDMFWDYETGTVGAFSQQGTAGPAGCDGYPPLDELTSVSTIWFPTTCGGFIETAYTAPGLWSATNRTAVTFAGTALEFSHSASCTSGVDCVMVPEPSPLLLLATGMLGMVYIRKRTLSPSSTRSPRI